MKIKKFKKYTKIVFGCLIIAITLNTFFAKMGLIPSGIFGFAILFNNQKSMPLALAVLLLNILFYVIGLVTTNPKKVYKATIPSILIPLFIWLTGFITELIDLTNVDTFLIAIYGGTLMGIGYQFIYKEDALASATDILSLIISEIVDIRKFFINYFLDFLWILFAGFSYGLEPAMYSLVAIIIMEILSKRANLGISDSKMFYIITKKDRDVKKYIMDELHYELTVFDVKGGFLETKNKVIMSVIPTKDYYKLKEGIKTIDPHAFISITDSYEVIKNKR